MTQFTIKPQKAAYVVDSEKSIANELDRYESDIRSISSALGFKIAAEYNLRNRLNKAADRVEGHRVCVSSMSSAIQSILNRYESAESAILGNQTTSGKTTTNQEVPVSGVEASSNDENYLNKLFKNLLKAILDALGKTGLVGGTLALPIAIAKMFIDGDGMSAKDWGALIKGAGNSGMGINKLVKWFKDGEKGGLDKLLGLEKYSGFKNVKPEASWFKRSGSSFVDSIKHEVGLNEDGTAIKGSKLAGWGLSLVSNCFSNYDEYKKANGDMSVGRAAAETITETLIDIGKGAAVAAGVAAGCAAIGVSAPAVVVGGIAVGVSFIADSVCEGITGKKVTEFVSDGILDFATDAYEAATGAVRSAGNAISGWWNKTFGGGSSAQYAGAW